MSELRARIVELKASGLTQAAIVAKLGTTIGTVQYHIAAAARAAMKIDTGPVYDPCVRPCLCCRISFRSWDRRRNQFCKACKPGEPQDEDF